MNVVKRLSFVFALLAAAVVMIALALPACAVGDAMFFLPDKAVDVGEEFSISLNFSSSDKIGNINAQVAYDSNVIEFVSGTSANGGGGMININENVSGTTDTTCVLTFKALKSGDSTVNIVTCNMTDENGQRIGSPYAYGTITVADNGDDPNEDSSKDSSSKEDPRGDDALSPADESSEASQPETSAPEDSSQAQQTETSVTDENAMPASGVLTSLTVDNGELSPDFAWNVYSYTVNVDYSVTNVEITATAADPSDYIWYSGSGECQVGENVRTITVTDAYGNETVYTVTVIRADEDEELSSAADPSSLKEMNIPKPKEQKSEDVISRNKGLINSALIIILLVLIIALVVIIYWIKNKATGNKKK